MGYSMHQQRIKQFLIVLVVCASSFSAVANELHDAVYEGDEQKVRDLIENKGFLAKVDELEIFFKYTPFYIAVKKANANIANFLLEKGANINAKNGADVEETPLHYAVRLKQADFIALLLKHKADPNIRDKNGKTPLHLAAINDDLQAAESLINAGARGNIHDGTNPDWHYLGYMVKDTRKYPLDHVSDQESALYKLLLKHRYPLHQAVLVRDRNAVEKLLGAKEIKIDEKNNAGETALFLAISPFDYAIAQLLVQNGADTNVLNQATKITMLKKARENDDLEAVKFLVENKATIDTSVLNDALKENKERIARYLIAHGAPLKIKGTGDAPLHIAARNRDRAMVELLIEHGALLTDKDSAGNTPLHLAAINNDFDMAKLLVGHGAESNALNDVGHFARDNVVDKSSELYSFLQKRTSPHAFVDIAIFLDDTQEEKAAKGGKMQAISQDIANAMSQQQLIIASSSLFSAIFSVSEHEKAMEHEKQLAINCISNLANYAIYQNEDRSITLLMPRRNPLLPNAELTNLGFDEKALKLVDEKDFKDLVLGTYERTFKLENLTSLFLVTNKPLKLIYLTGHGGQRSSIAHLPFPQYEALIQFLNKIGTVFLYVSTCYVGGINLIEGHKNLINALHTYEDGREKKFDVTFPIVAAGVTDAPTTHFAERFDRFFAGLRAYFFARSKSEGEIHFVPKSFVSILSNIGGGKLENTPQIRFPHSRGYFNVVDVDNNLQIVSYPQLLAWELSDKAKKLPTTTIVGEGKRTVLLYPGLIRLPLHLKGQATQYFGEDLPAIVSMIPGDALHYLEELRIDSLRLKDSEYNLRRVFSLGTPTGRKSFKAFLIKNLVVNGDDLGSVLITTSYSGDAKEEVTVRIYRFDKKDYSSLTRRKSVEPVGFADDTNKELLDLLTLLSKAVPSSDVLFQSSGGRETKATFRRIFNLFFPFKDIIDSLVQQNKIDNLEAILDLAIAENWQDVIKVFMAHPSFEQHFAIQKNKLLELKQKAQ